MFNFDQYQQLLKQLSIGKHLPEAIYIHKDTLGESTEIPGQLASVIKNIANALEFESDDWHVLKFFKRSFKVSYLAYPEFYTDAYPALSKSACVDLNKLTTTITEYNIEDNPPILHRKEHFISQNNQHYESFCAITQEGENAGLYDNNRMIGFKQSWARLIAKHGYELVDGRLFRSSALEMDSSDDKKIDRHRTAITRHELSAPMKQLAKHGYLDGDYTVFDYGCGKGDDLRELEAHGIDATGWDPNFRPDNDKLNADLVNIGFVINVIEDSDERMEAMMGAWQLADKLLVVSAMLANEDFIAQFKPFKDGVITSRNTFQKYFDQSELKAFIEKTLDHSAVAVAPGIYYLFKDPIEEQNFQLKRQRRNKSKSSWQQITAPNINSEAQTKLLMTTNLELFENYWQRAIELGRQPAIEEFEQTETLKKLVGSLPKAWRMCKTFFDEQDLQTAANHKKEDIIVYFALALFEQRQSYRELPEELQRDLKFFFNGIKHAQEEAKALLFSISNVEHIFEHCESAHQQLCASEYLDQHSLIFHKQYLQDLSPLLRVYVGAACQMYGELDEIDLIKIHIRSGKVSFMGYNHFESSPTPSLRERIKVKMWHQDIDFFDYQTGKEPLLLNKSTYLKEEQLDYKQQISFEKRLNNILDLQTPRNLYENQLKSLLKEKGYLLKGYRFFKK